MKKIVCLILALMLIVPLNVYADALPTVKLSEASAQPGQTVELELSIDDNPGIVSMILSITYDESALKLISVKDKGVFGTAVHGNNLAKSPYILCWANDTATQNYTVNGTLVTLSFQVKESAANGVYPISVSYDNSQFDIFDVDLNTVDFFAIDGSVTVSGATGGTGEQTPEIDDTTSSSGTSSGGASSGGSSSGGNTDSPKGEKPDIPAEDTTETTPQAPKTFADVHDAGHWAAEYVDYVCQKGIMNGTGENAFSPDATLTRAMLVTILHRLDKEPNIPKNVAFEDVEKDSYYQKAVDWAYAWGIVNGVSDTHFAPNDNITREQIAAIMHRYAQYKGYDVSVGENTNILSYDDFQGVSKFAISAVQYAVGSGLMRGKTDSTINPKDNATRAEAAAILQRFIENIK